MAGRVEPYNSTPTATNPPPTAINSTVSVSSPTSFSGWRAGLRCWGVLGGSLARRRRPKGLSTDYGLRIQSYSTSRGVPDFSRRTGYHQRRYVKKSQELGFVRRATRSGIQDLSALVGPFQTPVYCETDDG
eukprot:1184925-Prorocentrum_minimum.AAC.2